MTVDTNQDTSRRDGTLYDLLIVGTGAAGMAAAIRASELGATAAIVEGGEVVGGTCVNIGCIPSKYLIEAAQHVHTSKAPFPGIQPCDPQIAWPEIMERKREIVEGLRQEKYSDVLDTYDGVTLLRGRARLLGEGQVQVGSEIVNARKIIIATGARPAMPPIPGLAEIQPLDSTTAMEMESLPGSMVVVGGGAIGLELGQAFARFGVKVTVVEVQGRIIPAEDLDVSAPLTRALENEGIEILTGEKISRVSQDARGVVVHLESEYGSRSLTVDKILVATGRRANTEDLGLAEAGVELNARGFIATDEFMRTTNPEVYAAGDVNGGAGYVYVAAYGGGIAAQAALEEITGEEALAADFSATPRVTFTDPQVAAVGLTEAEARAAGREVKVTALEMKQLPRAIVSHRSAGLIKLVADAESDQLLGAHIVGANAGDVISEAVLAVRFGLRVQEIVSALHPYLTWSEGIKLAGQTFTKDVAKLSCCA